MLTSQVPPSIDSKRFFTSYPWSGSPFRSPSTPYLSDNLSSNHTQYVCRVCIALIRLSRLLVDDFCRVAKSGLQEGRMNTLRSKDGTTIAFDKQGGGPPLIVVDGAMSTRSGGSKPEL